MTKVVEIANLYGRYERSEKIPHNVKLKSAWKALGECTEGDKEEKDAKTKKKTQKEKEREQNEQKRTFKMYQSEQTERLVDHLNTLTMKISAALFAAVFIALVLLDFELEPELHARNLTKSGPTSYFCLIFFWRFDPSLAIL